jgi:hypothetical protein
MAEKERGTEPLVDWARVLGGALAAVSSAVLLSTLGAVGTLVGAALGSIVVSVASSIYSQGLRRSRARMAQAQEAALRRVGVAQAEVLRARRRTAPGATEAHLERADEQLDEARDRLETEPDAEPEREPLGQQLRRLPWRRIALLTGLMFVIAVAAITAFELVAGRSVSSYTGGTSSHHGTSLSNIDPGGHHKTTKPPSSPSPSPTTGTTPPTTSTTSTTSPTTPSTDPSPSSTPTPSASPSESPSDLPTPSPPAASPTG